MIMTAVTGLLAVVGFGLVLLVVLMLLAGFPKLMAPRLAPAKPANKLGLVLWVAAVLFGVVAVDRACGVSDDGFGNVRPN